MEKGSLPIGASVQRLDPLLQNLMSGCSMQAVLNLKEIIPTVDNHALQKMHPYLLVPMLGELTNKKLSNEVKTALLNCMNEVLTRVNISSISAVRNILQTLMMEVYDKKSPSMIKHVPEEMKLSIMDCALSTIRNMVFEVQDKFYVKENIPEICQVAYTCLELAVIEKMRPLRIRAMEVVIALQQIPLDGPDRRSPWERQIVADIFQFILPGACSKLITIVAGDVTQGSKVFMTAIFTLSSMIALVMEDYINNDCDDPVNIMAAIVELSKTSNEAKVLEDDQEHSPCHATDAKKIIESSQGRSPEWRKKIAAHLLPYLAKLGAQCQHSNFKVCKVVVCSCSLILQRCPVSLKEGLAPLLDALVVLSVHENEEVREESVSSLKQLREYFIDQNGYDFIQLAEENLYMLLTRLPRLVQEGGSTQGAASIALLSGYIQLLRPSMQNILSSAAHLQRLVLSLLHVVTLECSSINVGIEHSMRQLVYERYTDLHVPWTRLRVSEERSVLINIQQLFNIICEKSVGVFDIVCCQLMESLHSMLHFRKESVLLLNLLLLSASHVENDNAFEISTSLLDLYLSPDFLLASNNVRSVATISIIQQEIATVCLVVEGVGCCIEVMGKERAQAYLLRVLYPLLEHAGSANGSVSFAGRRALSRVADVFGYQSDLVSLISDNMDYLSHCMSIRLRHVNEHMGVFDALSLILHHSSSEIALGLSKIVLNVLQQSSDVTQSKNNEAHLRVFFTFTLGVQQWLKPNSNSSSTRCLGLTSKKLEILNESASEDLDLHCHSLFSHNLKWNAVLKLKMYQQNMLLASYSKNVDEETLERDPSEELPSHMQPHIMSDDMNGKNVAMDTASDTKDEVPMETISETTDEIPELAKLLELVLRRCLHFLPSPVIDHQLLALRTLEIGLQTLEPYTNTLLPIVHSIWNPLIGRFEANQSPLIIRNAFQLLLIMSKTAKDFLLSHIVREIFPKVTSFLKNAVDESHLKDKASAYRFSQKYKTQVALLSGLGSLSCHLNLRGQDFHCLLSVCLLYLSCWQPRSLQAAAVSLITSLHSLDADAVWWALVSWWTPPHLAYVLQLPQPSPHGDCEANVRLLLGI